MFKTITIVVVTLLLVVGMLGLSLHHYNLQQHQKAAIATKQSDDQQAQLAAIKRADSARYTALASNYQTAVAECQKGVAAYAQVPALTKAKLQLAAPTCPDPIR